MPKFTITLYQTYAPAAAASGGAVLFGIGMVFGKSMGKMDFAVVASHKVQEVGSGRKSYRPHRIGRYVTNRSWGQTAVKVGIIRRLNAKTVFYASQGRCIKGRGVGLQGASLSQATQ